MGTNKGSWEIAPSVRNYGHSIHDAAIPGLERPRGACRLMSIVQFQVQRCALDTADQCLPDATHRNCKLWYDGDGQPICCRAAPWSPCSWHVHVQEMLAKLHHQSFWCMGQASRLSSIQADIECRSAYGSFACSHLCRHRRIWCCLKLHWSSDWAPGAVLQRLTRTRPACLWLD